MEQTERSLIIFWIIYGVLQLGSFCFLSTPPPLLLFVFIHLGLLSLIKMIALFGQLMSDGPSQRPWRVFKAVMWGGIKLLSLTGWIVVLYQKSQTLSLFQVVMTGHGYIGFPLLAGSWVFFLQTDTGKAV